MNKKERSNDRSFFCIKENSVLEGISKFNLNATVERIVTFKLIVASAINYIVIDGIASQIKAGGKREGFVPETGSNGSI